MRILLSTVQLEKAPLEYSKYVNKLNARHVAGTKHGIGDLIAPIFRACAESPVVRESPNPQLELVKCAMSVMELATLYLKNEVMQ